MDEDKAPAIKAAENLKRVVLKGVALDMDKFIGWVNPDATSLELTVEIKYGDNIVEHETLRWYAVDE